VTPRRLSLRREVLTELRDDELTFVGGNDNIVTEVGCTAGCLFVAALRHALSLDSTCMCLTAGCTAP
jgi:hypothetical protein